MVGKFAKGIFTGLGAPKRGMSFLGEHPKLISWCVIPVIINYLIDQGLIRADERAPRPALIGNGRV